MEAVLPAKPLAKIRQFRRGKTLWQNRTNPGETPFQGSKSKYKTGF